MSFDFEGAKSGGEFRRLLFLVLGLALKYRRLILAFCGVALAIGVGVSLRSTPIFRATGTIQIDREAPRVVKTSTPEDNGRFEPDSRFYQTQYDILKSRLLADQVASDLNLGAALDFIHPQSTSAFAKLRSLIFGSVTTKTDSDPGNLQERQIIAVGMVQGGLSIDPVSGSNLVKVSFDSPSSDWAQRVANGIADSYIKLNLDRRYSATAYARNFLKERLQELKLKLEESEKDLVAYSEQKQLINDDKHSIAESDLAALNGALQKVVAQRINAQQLWEQANSSNGLALPQVLQDSSIQKLMWDRAALTTEYQNKRATFTPAYPDMLKLKAQINAVNREIDSAVDMVKQSLKAAYDSTLQQETLLKQKLDEVKEGVLSTRDKEIQYNILKREADTNRTLYEGLLQQYKDIGVAGAVNTNNVSVVDRAQLPSAPYKPDLKMILAIALLLGLLAAGLLIALLEILDDTFKSPEEIEEQLGLALLGMIPNCDGDHAEALIESGKGHFAEALRSLRTALQFSTDQGVPKTLLVTSAQPGEGKSTTALGLAVNFTQLGTKVLLIDADLRNPSQHRYLKCDNPAGLSNYLSGRELPERLLQKTSVSRLYLMTSGPLPPNPSELLAGPKMMSLLSLCGEKFDLVIIDSPPVIGLADAPLLSSMALGTLFVISMPDTRCHLVKNSLKRLYFARARIIGAAMNKCDVRSHYGYGYGYGLEYYGYGQQKTTAQLDHSVDA